MVADAVATDKTDIALVRRPGAAGIDSVMAYGRPEPAVVHAETRPLVLVTAVSREDIAREELRMQPPLARASIAAEENPAQ